jgi:transcriptional regulator with XRE-family HTH domain
MPGKDRDPKIPFGKAVRFFRNAAGLSQERLASSARVHRTYIGDVERGTKNISLESMVRIAHALDVPLSRLIAEMEKSRS